MLIRRAVTRSRELLSKRSTLIVVAVALVVPLIVVKMSTGSEAESADEHRVTFVNNSGETLWLGSAVNADGSQNIPTLPTLADGQSATIVVPDAGSPNYWRGKFFARQACAGEPGSTFHCVVGDCGVYADHCAVGEQPASLAEFNFDRNDGLATWYNVSYVNAVSLGITISSPNSSGPVAGSCINADCSAGELLAACPPAYAQADPQTGRRINCVNPNRDAESDYTQAMMAYQPRGYLWSTQDRVPGNSTVFNCPQCSDFVVTFHGAGAGAAPPPAQPQPVAEALAPRDSAEFSLRGYVGKCIDVPGGLSNDGAQLQLWDCNGTAAQRFTAGPNGSLVVVGKCMDVAWADTQNGAKVQIAWCNGGPAQIWIAEDGSLRNPHSNKCIDVRDWNSENGAALQIWDCSRNANQLWTVVEPASVMEALAVPAPAAEALAVPGGQQSLRAYVTGFSYFDNTPPGSADIAYPVLHQRADGTGTYADPITVAVGHSSNGGQDMLDWPAGTRFYVPNLRRYFIVEDACGDGPSPQDGPCHTGFPPGASTWLDVWIGGEGGSTEGSEACMNALTDVWDVLVDPRPGYAVVAGAVYGATGCTEQYGNAVAAS